MASPPISPPLTPPQGPSTSTTSTSTTTTPTQPPPVSTPPTTTPPTTTPPTNTPPTSTSSTTTISLPLTTLSTSTATPTTSTTPLPTTTSAILTTAPGGGVVTITSVITTSSSRNVAPTNSADSSNSGNGFFHNKGAVAGVFTVVGLIVLAILIAFITNAIRRRRAKKFDDEIAAAARDAANAQVPNFAYADDDDDFRPGAYGSSANTGAKFSDVSHGTYAQTPMSVPESYGMREMPHQGGGANPGEYFDAYAVPAGAAGAAGAAGIGVARARSKRDGAYAAGLKEGSSPYAAFAARGANNAGPQYPPGMIRGAGGPEFDLNRRPSQYTQQTDYSAPSRNKSLTHSASAPSYQSDPSYYPSSSDNGNGAYVQGQQSGYPNSFGAYTSSSSAGGAAGSQQKLQPIPASRSEEDLNAAYDGYTVDEPPQMQTKGSASPPPASFPNPFSATGRPDEYADETDDEAEEPKRVLKVANQ